jgi:hypothetical protein
VKERRAGGVSDPAPEVKATRRLFFGGGSHEARLATSAGAAGHVVGFLAYPSWDDIKHPRSSVPSKPASNQHVYLSLPAG